MRQHLSEKEIAGWAMGEHAAELRLHVRECAECRGQTESLSEALLEFRRSAQEAAERLQPPVRLPEPARWWRVPARWALATAAIVLLASIPVLENARRQRAARELAFRHAQEVADAALLRQVDAGISRAVPETMEPLVSLVSWSSVSAAGQ